MMAMLWAILLMTAMAGCSTTAERPSPPPPSPAAAPAAWGAGTVLDTRTGQPIPLATLLETLGGADVIYLGEEHHNQHHIESALTVVRFLTDRGRRPVLGLEMFSWDGQAALDRQVSADPMPTPEFLEVVKWAPNWGGPYEHYAPLVAAAKAQGLRLRALNAPRPLVRKVAKEGLARAVELPEVSAWGMRPDELVDDPAYRTTILDQLKACHGGGGEERHFVMMYEASLFRDEAMARTLAQEVRTTRAQGDPAAGPVVSYTGGGHIQYRLPIPNRVARRVGDATRQVSVYLASAEQDRAEEVQEWIQRRIADYIWLTPVGAHGPPARCR